ATVEATWWQARWRANVTAQDPVDELTGLRLPSRARRFGTVEVDRAFGPLRAGLAVHASGDRFDRPAEVDRIPGYATVDARLSYAIGKRWAVELSAANLADKRRETSIGYDAPRRTFLVTLKLEAF
ncbi:MAG TPA: TonB-dependent receptor, partial [Terriglobales bacterium]|nr:TonB-dependent receptor [Terriglobales bacterium]